MGYVRDCARRTELHHVGCQCVRCQPSGIGAQMTGGNAPTTTVWQELRPEEEPPPGWQRVPGSVRI